MIVRDAIHPAAVAAMARAESLEIKYGALDGYGATVSVADWLQKWFPGLAREEALAFAAGAVEPSLLTGD